MTRAVNINLPDPMADAIDAKVRSGAYASFDDVVRDGVQSLLDTDLARERWLRDEVLKGHAEYLADPSKAVPSYKLLARIRTRRNESER